MLGTLLAVVEEDRLGSMVSFFLIALVLMSPFGFRLYRRTMQEKRALLDDGRDTPVGGSDDLDDAPGADDLTNVIAAITAAGRDLSPGESDEIEVASGTTVDGRPATAAVVDALVADAARRSGLDAAWSATADGDRRLRVTRR